MIDSMLYRAIIPAGTYAAGAKIPLVLVDGPSVVRDGYGEAKLKSVFTITDNLNLGPSFVEVKNQNWVDSMINLVTSANGNGIYYILSEDGPCFQKGGDNLREQGIRVESLAIVDEMDDCSIKFREQ